MCSASQNMYVVCSKSIEPLVRKNTFIHLEQIYSNLVQISPLGNAHTYPSRPALVGNTSGTRLLEWCSAGPSRSA
jgi:hypothetical protein